MPTLAAFADALWVAQWERRRKIPERLRALAQREYEMLWLLTVRAEQYRAMDAMVQRRRERRGREQVVRMMQGLAGLGSSREQSLNGCARWVKAERARLEKERRLAGPGASPRPLSLTPRSRAKIEADQARLENERRESDTAEQRAMRGDWVQWDCVLRESEKARKRRTERHRRECKERYRRTLPQRQEKAQQQQGLAGQLD
ncbi:uncharacterized protein B0T15DRAFT_558048 [Chaetomium strumarium]|uniref:Uncharacterized protein n=1 Tax=Chaetomium strumarium TaxID=1170767 RepID=A0AAJ0M0I0_9PEZI|nr:hypothetical protein B0T15DRAFT_558048 [Chaetomium strumarium]